ncbi:MAG: hypothetical protein ACT6R2_20640, partial [Blastomonas fulva]|uniref:hypothetical protein n=1 Tax=Blastomonas fulva TaxID=1550728 RepID=UPI0040347157
MGSIPFNLGEGLAPEQGFGWLHPVLKCAIDRLQREMLHLRMLFLQLRLQFMHVAKISCYTSG